MVKTWRLENKGNEWITPILHEKRLKQILSLRKNFRHLRINYLLDFHCFSYTISIFRKLYDKDLSQFTELWTCYIKLLIDWDNNSSQNFSILNYTWAKSSFKSVIFKRSTFNLRFFYISNFSILSVNSQAIFCVDLYITRWDL